MKKVAIIILHIFLGLKLYACECDFSYSLKKLDSINFRNYKIVLTGEIFQISDTQYSIKVIDVLKGNIRNKIITGIYGRDFGSTSSCAFYPRYQNVYLLFLTEVQGPDGLYYYASECVGNRSLNLADCLYCSQNEDIKEKQFQYTKKWINKNKQKKTPSRNAIKVNRKY